MIKKFSKKNIVRSKKLLKHRGGALTPDNISRLHDYVVKIKKPKNISYVKHLENLHSMYTEKHITPNRQSEYKNIRIAQTSPYRPVQSLLYKPNITEQAAKVHFKTLRQVAKQHTPKTKRRFF